MNLLRQLMPLLGAATLSLIAATAHGQVTVSWPDIGSCCTNSNYGELTGPYSVTINGASADVICDDLASQFTPPISWEAEVTTPGFGTKFSSANVNPALGTGFSTAQAYDAVAYLAEEMVSGEANAGLLNWAIWDIFDYSDVNNASGYGATLAGDGLTGTVNALATNALAKGTAANLAGVTILTPTNLTSTVEQELITVNAPEASVFKIFLVDLFGIAVIAFTFRRLGASGKTQSL